MATALARSSPPNYTGTEIGQSAPGRAVSVLLQSGLGSVVFGGATHAGPRALRIHTTYIVTTAAAGEIALESEHGRLLTSRGAGGFPTVGS